MLLPCPLPLDHMLMLAQLLYYTLHICNLLSLGKLKTPHGLGKRDIVNKDYTTPTAVWPSS